MYNSERKGTDAYYAMQEFVNADKTHTAAVTEIEHAAENACTVISQLTDDIDDKNDDIRELETKIEELETKLKVDDAIEFIRVLKNVQVYVADHIEVLEKKYGEDIEAKTNSEE